MSEGLSKKLSLYNFIFTIGIVIYHCKNFNALYSSSVNGFLNKMYGLYDLIGLVSMGFFFMVSAYLFYLGINSNADLYKKMKKRVITLGIPFLTWNVIILLYNIFYGIVKGTLSLGFTDFILGFTFQPFDGPLWYIFALLLLMLFAPLIYKLKNHPKVFLGIIIGALVGGSLCKSLVTSDNEAIQWATRLIGYVPIYLFGAYFGLCKNEFVSKEKYNYKLVAIISASISVEIIVYFMLLKQDISVLNYILQLVLPITIWLSTYNSMYEKIKIRYPLKVTFFVYALHMLLIGIFNTLLTKAIGYNSLNPAISFFAHFVFVAILYFVCLAVAYISGKFLPSKFYFALSGGRVEGGRAAKGTAKQ